MAMLALAVPALARAPVKKSAPKKVDVIVPTPRPDLPGDPPNPNLFPQ